MAVRVIILLVLAVVVGVGTIIFARKWIAAERANNVPTIIEREVTVSSNVLVVRDNLAPGYLIRQENLVWQPWPTDDLPPSYVVQGERERADFIGAVVRFHMSAGEPVTDRKLVKSGERGFMAAVLTPGTRAATVPVNDPRGAAGFIFPGDRVDLILVHQAPDPMANDGVLHRVGETVMANIKVLAIDQRLDNPDGQAQIGRTATLEVTPRQVEAINVMLQLGSVSLSLRSLEPASQDELIQLADASVTDPKEAIAGKVPTFFPGGLDEHAERQLSQTYTLDTDVSVLLGAPPRRTEAADGVPVPQSTGRVVIIRGNAVH